MSRHYCPRHEPDTLPAIEGLKFPQMSHLPREEGRLAPDGAHEQGGGVGAGRHWVEHGIPHGGIDILRLVGDQQEVGGLAAGMGTGRRRNKRGPRLTEPHRVVNRAHHRFGQRVGEQAVAQSIPRNRRLRLESWRGDDYRATEVRPPQEQDREHLGEHFVLACLAAEDGRELVASLTLDALQDRFRRRQLISAQGTIRQQH